MHSKQGLVVGVYGHTGAGANRNQERNRNRKNGIAEWRDAMEIDWMTAKEIGNLAQAMQSLTLFDDEAIQSGENILLTFTNIGSTVFPQATMASLDMAQAMGMDASNAARLLGKALNDPTQGLSALSRVGIQFTDQQKAQIESMQKMGDVAGAQALILGELEKKYGGSAKAAAEGVGVFIQIKNEFGNKSLMLCIFLNFCIFYF